MYPFDHSQERSAGALIRQPLLPSARGGVNDRLRSNGDLVTLLLDIEKESDQIGPIGGRLTSARRFVIVPGNDTRSTAS